MFRSDQANSSAIARLGGNSYAVTGTPLLTSTVRTISATVSHDPPDCPSPIRGICTLALWSRAYSKTFSKDCATATYRIRGDDDTPYPCWPTKLAIVVERLTD